MARAIKEVETLLNPVAEAQPATHPIIPPSQPLIFIVDDEYAVGEVVAAILQMDGYATQLFQCPEAALRAFEQADRRPQLLVTDFVMGTVNGMELIDQFLRIDPFLKTVLYSGNVGEEIMRKYLVQPDRFVSKPFHPKQLTDAVRGLLPQL